MATGNRKAEIGRCRVCGGTFHPTPLLHYANMPGYAQFMPDAAGLAADRGVDLDICQCSGCGLIQLNGQPVPYYREVVRAAAFSGDMRAFRVRQFTELVERYGLAGRRAIEIGCGRGEYLAVLRESGLDACGLEYARDSVAQARADGLTAYRGFVAGEHHRIPGAPYDAFFILNFLEHLPHPVRTLRGIAANLTTDGIGLVEVPNFDMIVEKGLFSEFIPDHLFYFTQATLTQLLEMAGFEVIDCRPVWHDYILSAMVRRRRPLDLSHLTGYQQKIAQDVESFVDRFPAKSIAVWGAGHQALAVLALLDLGNRLRYVVDSAPFKQGKFTPATHLPIGPPSWLRSDPVSAVIVMAASYSDEVVRILRRDYDPAIAVAVLRDHGLEWIGDGEVPPTSQPLQG